MTTKIPETRRTSSNISNFLTLSPLDFRLTGRGRSVGVAIADDTKVDRFLFDMLQVGA